MKRLAIRYRTANGAHQVDLHFLDWMAWEKHTGKTAAKGPDSMTDLGYLAWHACKRAGETRPFELWAVDLVGLPETEVIDTEDPTQPGA